jgi:hypothetical protein
LRWYGKKLTLKETKSKKDWGVAQVGELLVKPRSILTSAEKNQPQLIKQKTSKQTKIHERHCHFW